VGSGLVTSPTTASASPATPSKIADAPSWTTHATKLAAPSASKKLSFTVTLQPGDQAAAQAYAESVSDPSSANYHKYLTPAQYDSRFGPSAGSTDAVKSWLTGQNLQVTGHGTGYLQVSGTVGSVDSAFNTTIGAFSRDKQTVTAPIKAISVPQSVKAQVQSVVGLDSSPNYTSDIATQSQLAAIVAKQLGKSLPSGAPQAAGMTNGCSTSAGQNQTPYLDPAPAPLNKREPNSVCGYTPAQLNSARGVTSTGLTGKNVNVGIVLWCDDPNLLSDTSRWAADVGAKKFAPGQVTIDEPTQPYSQYCASNGGADQVETSLDTEAIHGAAPAADIVYSPATGPTDDGLVDALHRLVDANSVDVISNSWGEMESELTPDAQAAYEAVFTQAAAQGISVLFSSGDNSDNFDTAPHANYPASDPWVTSIGGTSLSINASNKTTSEEAWYTSVSQEEGSWTNWSYGYGGGGGTSSVFPQPDYQKGVVPSSLAGATPMRVYPDIANVADPATGYLIGYTDILGNFEMSDIGGTSLASPYTAGQLALAVQRSGHRTGFLNPAIYANGSKDLTDLSSNTVDQGEQLATDELEVFGYPVLPVSYANNSQSLVPTSLSLAPGYDNMSGMGVPSNESKFIKLVSNS
jgi:subtilase family serine protease